MRRAWALAGILVGFGPGLAGASEAPAKGAKASAAAKAKAPAPTLRVEAQTPEYEDWREEVGCPFRVVAQGFPAISSDGSQVVTAEVYLDESEGEYEALSVDWLRAADGTVAKRKSVYDFEGVTRAKNKGVKDDPCIAVERKAKRVARAINRQLRDEGWRPMMALDLKLPVDPYFADEQEEDEAATPDPHPFEAFWRKGRMIVRRRGVKVYANAAAPWENVNSENAPGDPKDWEERNVCEYEPVLEAIYGDPATGTLAVSYDYDQAATSCICTSEIVYGVIQADVSLFPALSRAATK